MDQPRESAVGALLRAAGVVPNARRSDLHEIGLREAERKTGVSRQTLSVWLRDLEAGERRKYEAFTLDKVANALGIDRRALGVAAMKDSGQVLSGNDELDDLYSYLSQRDDAEQRQIMAWLAQRLAERGDNP